MIFNTFPLVLALASTAHSFPAVGGLFSRSTAVETSVFEKIDGPPTGWVEDEEAVVDKEASMMRLRIHLVHQNMQDFHDVALKIATPGDKLYGSHLSQKVIDDMIAPKDESKDLVLEWLDSVGLSSQVSMSSRADSVILEASISQIEKLLDAEYSAYVQSESGEKVVRTLEYSLPVALKDHVDMVQPTTFFGLKAMRSTISEHHLLKNTFSTAAASAVTGCSTSGYITPACLSHLYNYTAAGNYSNGLMGIAGFLEQYPIKSDLTTFMRTYSTQNNVLESFDCTLINGGSCPQTASGAGVEANLDVQYARAITANIPNVFYSTSGSPPWLGTGSNTNEPYLEFLDYLLALNTTDLPNTISISYGDDEDTVPVDYATNVCDLFAQLGARGVSILVASGDSGVGSTCTSNGVKTFTTNFPASCPWVTVVGGTTGNTPESAWGGSGGGFSTVFAQPSYQTDAVNTWLTTDTTHDSVSAYFNASGRAYPDVSAQSTSFIIMVDGAANLVSGTSCAAPTFSSLIQLLNSDRLLEGKTPLGFLNPWLYSNGTEGLTDITKGSNSGCSGSITGAGFSAVAGWDPATGLGTPNYGALLEVSRAT